MKSDVKVWCDIMCGCCGGLLADSGYDVDKRKLKSKAKQLGWKYTEDYGNTCPDCLKEMKKVEE